MTRKVVGWMERATWRFTTALYAVRVSNNQTMKYFWERIKNLFKPSKPKYGIFINQELFDSLEKGEWYMVNGFWKRTEEGEIVLNDLSIFQVKTRDKLKKMRKELEEEDIWSV